MARTAASKELPDRFSDLRCRREKPRKKAHLFFD